MIAGSLYNFFVRKDKAIEPIYIPRGVASPDCRTGCVAVDFKTIEALDLLKGLSLWNAQQSGMPLIVLDNRLIILQAPEEIPNQLQVAILEFSKSGELIFKCDPIIFPSWVTTAFLPSHLFNFNVHFEQDELLFTWRAHAYYQGGAPPPEYVLAKANKDEAGVARINLKNGRVKMFPHPGERDEPLPAALQQTTLFSYQMGRSGVWHNEPWDIADQKAVITGEIYADKQRLYLQKWNPITRQAGQPVFLLEGRALVLQLTQDGRFLFIHSEAPVMTMVSARRPWWVFSVETGRLISELEYEMGAQEPCVPDSNVYYIVEESSSNSAMQSTIRYLMKSRLLSSGDLRWERVLSEGPVTPSPSLRP